MTVLRKYFCKRMLRKNYFLQAIAYQGENEILKNDDLIWAFYNLGMYKTASEFSVDSLNCKGLIVKIISLAACGNFDQAKNILNDLQTNFNCKKSFVQLIDALVPFMPETAYSLINEVDLPISLLAALHLKLGYTSKAQELLVIALKEKKYRQKPELLLYYSNSMGECLEVKEQLTLVNKYLLHFQLPKLILKNKTSPLSTLNIECHSLKKSTGPLISILMTTYKTGSRADIAIESILKQTYQNIELIVVDDASGDTTVDIVKKWMELDKRVRLIELSENVGTYVAKNIALLQAKGEFITCHDSDDWSHPLKIEKQVKPLLKNKKLIASISSWVRLSDTGEFYARPVHPLMRQNPSSLLFRKKEVLENAGIWDCVRTGADSEFIARLKLVFGRQKIKRIKVPLSFGAHREDSLMTAEDTGYCELGMSPVRLAYWESWNQWHIDEFSNGNKPFLPANMLEVRKYCAPGEILNEQKKMQEVIERYC